MTTLSRLCAAALLAATLTSSASAGETGMGVVPPAPAPTPAASSSASADTLSADDAFGVTDASLETTVEALLSALRGVLSII